jgi:pimeloyl-ACP methyl ester carboxylesterase
MPSASSRMPRCAVAEDHPMHPPLIDLGGHGTPLHIAVANGFPPQTYGPLVQALGAGYHALSLPPRALWPQVQPPTQLEDWETLADDLLHGLRTHHLHDVVAVGHSFGGVASLLAVLQEPQRFRALCLLDPAIFPPDVLEAIASVRQMDNVDWSPLSRRALMRRAHFPDVESAYSYWRGKELFRTWPEESFRLYVEHGTHPAPEGGLTLTWSPQWEAYYFATIHTRIWSILPQLADLLPVLLLYGAESDVMTQETVQRMQTLIPQLSAVRLEGQGHLFPQVAPQEVAHPLRTWLNTL